ncbi:MAG: MFS transporter [Candidatus Omnitrophica bacterium]|nr:MFS transporter [Candidatus Omnitrophota bacterium]
MFPRAIVVHLGIAYAALSVGGSLDNARGPLLPDMIAELQITDQEASLFFAVAALMSIAGSLLAGPTLQRVRTVVALRYVLGCVMLGYWGVAFGTHYAIIVLGNGLYGIGMGANHVILNIMVAQAAPVKTRARHLNFLHVMYGLASLSAPMVIIGLRGAGAGWRMTFLLLTLLPVPVILAGLRDRLPCRREPSVNAIMAPLPWWNAWRHPAARYYAVLLGLYVSAELAVSMWLVLYVTRLRIADPAKANLFLSYFFCMMTAARFGAAIFLRTERYRTLLACAAGGGIVALLWGIYGHPVGLVLAAAPMGLFFPLCFASLSHEVTAHLEVVTSWVMCTVFVVIAAGQFMMGWLSDHYSIAVAMHLPVVLLILVSLLLLMRHPRAQ